MLTTRQINVLYTLFLIGFVLLFASPALGQQSTSADPTHSQIAISKAINSSSSAAVQPVYTDFMGVKLGMSANEVRQKLREPKNKSDAQDFFVLSDSQTAQVVYDSAGKVVTISVDYTKGSDAPSPEAVIGEAVQPRADGSVYQLKRYPQADYWVAYSRTAGDNPMVTVTMQRM